MTTAEMSDREDLLVDVDDVDTDSDEYRLALLDAIADQADELGQQMDLTVTCPCGTTGPVILMYQCFHCEVHFCPDCAKKHFTDGTDVPIEEIRAAVQAVVGRIESDPNWLGAEAAAVQKGARDVLEVLADREGE